MTPPIPAQAPPPPAQAPPPPMWTPATKPEVSTPGVWQPPSMGGPPIKHREHVDAPPLRPPTPPHEPSTDEDIDYRHFMRSCFLSLPLCSCCLVLFIAHISKVHKAVNIYSNGFGMSRFKFLLITLLVFLLPCFFPSCNNVQCNV